MAKVLFIEASPRGDHSYSTRVARHFLDSYSAYHPHDDIDHLNLWEAALPPFDGYVQQAKYALMHGKPYTPQQAEAWKAVERVITHFKAAEKFVFSVPMWNYGIPYILKHYLDVILQPTYTFSVTEKHDYVGLVQGRPTALVFARGGQYLAGSGMEALDFQAPYLHRALAFIGLTNPHSIYVEGTAGPSAQESLTKALAAANALSSRF